MIVSTAPMKLTPERPRRRRCDALDLGADPQPQQRRADPQHEDPRTMIRTTSIAPTPVLSRSVICSPRVCRQHGRGGAAALANGQPEESLTCHQPISIPIRPSRGLTCQTPQPGSPMSQRDPHVPVRPGSSSIRSRRSGWPPDVGPLGDRRACRLEPLGQLVADPLELAQVEQPRVPACAPQVLGQAAHRVRRHERVRELALEPRDLRSQGAPRRAARRARQRMAPATDRLTRL